MRHEAARDESIGWRPRLLLQSCSAADWTAFRVCHCCLRAYVQVLSVARPPVLLVGVLQCFQLRGRFQLRDPVGRDIVAVFLFMRCPGRK